MKFKNVSFLFLLLTTLAAGACGPRAIYTAGRGDSVAAPVDGADSVASEAALSSGENAAGTSLSVADGQGANHAHHDHHGEHGHHGHSGAADGSGVYPPHGHQHAFDNPEQYAARWEGPERDAWQQPEQLVAELGIEAGMSVADLGTGTGYLLPWLSQAAGQNGVVLAIDVEPAMLEWVAGRIAELGWGNVSTHAGEYDSPGVAPATLDRAVMLNVWHHIEHRDVYAAALLQSMKPGGVAFIVETRMDAPDGPPMHYRLPPEAVIEVLLAAGFEASLTDWQNERQYMVRARRPE
jgi:predicted methyltransferase